MKTALYIVMICLAATLTAQQSTTMTAATTTQQEDSPLVKAAKSGHGPRKKSTKKVITNADVKSAKGKITVLPPKPGQSTAAAAGPADNRAPLQKQDDDRHAREAATVRVNTAQKRVDDLQKELRRIEEAYYAENDPNYRDATIASQFTHTRQQLDDARQELSDARDVQQKLSPRS